MAISKLSWYMNTSWSTLAMCFLDAPVLTKSLILLGEANGLLNVFIFIDT